jgi:hypothetical protein
MTAPREVPWYADMPELDDPVPDYLAALTATTDRLLARCRTVAALGAADDAFYRNLRDVMLDEADADACAIDHAAVDEWLESPAARDYLPETEA